MAIAINGRPVEILGGIQISDLYLRFSYELDMKGKNIRFNTSIYQSKDAYESDMYNNQIKINEIQSEQFIAYDSSLNGKDVLMYIHDYISTDLTIDKTQEMPVLITDPSEYGLDYDASTNQWFDPDTGYIWNSNTNWLEDPSTGKILTEDFILTPKFCEPAQLTIVDMGIIEPK
jgi:hypothetical protein